MDQKHAYSAVEFANISMTTISIKGKSSEFVLLMLDDLNIDKSAQKIIVMKVMKIVIRCT